MDDLQQGSSTDPAAIAAALAPPDGSNNPDTIPSAGTGVGSTGVRSSGITLSDGIRGLPTTAGVPGPFDTDSGTDGGGVMAPDLQATGNGGGGSARVRSALRPAGRPPRPPGGSQQGSAGGVDLGRERSRGNSSGGALDAGGVRVRWPAGPGYEGGGAQQGGLSSQGRSQSYAGGWGEVG